MNLKERLKKSRDALGRKLGTVFNPGVDGETLEDAEAVLLSSDLGWELTELVLERFRRDFRESGGEWRSSLARVLIGLIPDSSLPERINTPEITMVVGVNGAGKTTTIARLAGTWKASGEQVLMVCADTYRAAAAEQLSLWGERLDIQVFRSAEGTDPGAVAFDGVRKALSGSYDRVIIDTAGRLPTQKGLMDELSKVYRVAGKAMEGAPHRVLLVLDGTVGQNALPQARQFMESVPVTELAVTKLDGTAKGGAVFAMSRELELPIRYIGVGEGAEDIIPFRAGEFVEALIGRGDEL
ncbi:signal recognition particle-docking protein FtsY [Candidatus Fermentibacteria bacterium]|nr:MAG: signal recognition particle-docking protein FtsY [Candidatus Fermentibacteria bacterium]